MKVTPHIRFTKGLLPLLGLLCWGTLSPLPCSAQETVTATAAKKKPISPALKKAVSKLRYASSKRLSTKAQYYIYLQSGSQCANCNREMPEVVKAYQEMKACGRAVDLLLICHDNNPETALNFMKKYGADFPVVLRKDVNPDVLPGFESAHGIPYWQIVRTDTAEATKGRGPALEDWRRKTIDKPTLPHAPSDRKKAKERAL